MKLQLRLCTGLSESITYFVQQLTSSLSRLAPQLHHAEHQRIAGNAEQSRDADISPSIISLVNVHRPEIVRTGGVRAVLARGAVVWVSYVTRVRAEEFGHVLSTRCAGGQGDLCKLVWPALDLDIVDDGLKKTAD
jgi:hypothetical protein